MSTKQENSDRKRQKLLTPILLGVFLLSVFVSWMLVRAYSIPTERGVDTLATIQQKTLESIWGNQPQIRLYLLEDRLGRPIGCEMYIRKPITGGYKGERLTRNYGPTPSKSRSVWTLSSQANIGQYESQISDRDGEIRLSLSLEEKSVTVEFSDHPFIRHPPATAPRPSNYIPEGALEAVLKQVASSGKKNRLRLIYDKLSISHGSVNFLGITLTPKNSRKVVLTHERASAYTTTFLLDDNGEVTTVEYPNGERLTKTTIDQIERSFPRDAQAIRELIRRSNLQSQTETTPPAKEFL